MRIVAELARKRDWKGMRRSHAWVIAAWLASSAIASAEVSTIQSSDLLTVRARLIDCPDRLRLVEVIRVGPKFVDILDLGSFRAIGRSAADLLGEVRARYRSRVPNTQIPPIEIGILPQADAQEEVVLLKLAEADLACSDPLKFRRPDRLPNPLFERVASR